jgi:hypothetical protein
MYEYATHEQGLHYYEVYFVLKFGHLLSFIMEGDS